MKLIVCRTFALAAACALVLPAGAALAQGVTTSGITGEIGRAHV